MFLKRMFLLRGQAESGSALLTVVGLLGVTGVIALTITTASLHAVGYTSSTRAGVQAQAAAAAGIDFAAANLATSACQAQYSSTSAPLFTVTVASSTLQTSPGDTDTSWVSGCPTSGDVKRLKFVSTGTASALGVAGNSSGNVRRVEAIYPYTLTVSAYEVVPSGALIYAYNQSTDTTINNLTITNASTVQPSIQYREGSITKCQPNSDIQADVVLGHGSFDGKCTIHGNLSASGDVAIDKPGTISGNVNAGGSVTDADRIGGTVSMNQSGTIPLVPGWVDYAYSRDDWKTDSGALYTLFTLSGCTPTTLNTALTSAQASLTPTIVDTRTCGSTTNPTTTITDNLTLKSDMVILGNNFIIDSNKIESSDTSDKRLWIIIPDTNADGKPTCPSNVTATIAKNQDPFDKYVGALFYSPCPISSGPNANWQGQLYTISLSSTAHFDLSYIPIGLPGVSLSTGQKTPAVQPGTGILKPRTSIRDLTVG